MQVMKCQNGGCERTDIYSAGLGSLKDNQDLDSLGLEHMTN